MKTSTALAEFGDVLTPVEVQRVLGIGRNATYELIASGKLRSIRVTPRRIIVTRRALEEFLRTDADMTMNEPFDRFMQAKENRLAATTLQRYEGLLRLYLRPALGARKVGAVKAVDLLAIYIQWSSRSVSPRTVRHAAELLRNILRKAVKWDVIGRSPAASLDADDLPKVIKPESKVLTETEVQQLLRETRNPTRRRAARRYLTAYTTFYPAVAFALFTGARLGEIMAVRWQDVDYRQQIITISRSMSYMRSEPGSHSNDPRTTRYEQFASRRNCSRSWKLTGQCNPRNESRWARPTTTRIWASNDRLESKKPYRASRNLVAPTGVESVNDRVA
jgi:excisionase family DNA binding protein